MKSMAGASIGLVGLGTMGRGLAENFMDHGIAVHGWNLDPEPTRTLAAARPEFRAAPDLAALCAELPGPRTLLLMIPAGEAVDQVIGQLCPLLQSGDMLLDGGNSHYEDTARRATAVQASGCGYAGLGISGGEAGARHGPSLMFGGDEGSWRQVAAMLEAIAASSAHGACARRVGPAPAGHFVKMVHNGIEYADMQLLAEAYDLMLRGAGLSHDAIAEHFAAWQRGPLASYLTELTAKVLTRRDGGSGEALVGRILDQAGQKGTGRWSVETAGQLGVAVPTISAAVDARVLSSRKRQRVELAARYPRVASTHAQASPAALESALLCARLCAYAQGFELLHAASSEFDWNLQLADIARTWTGGCIIRAAMLDDLIEALTGSPDATELLHTGFAATLMNNHMDGLRAVLNEAQSAGLPAPALAASLAWFDALRSERLPQNLIQAQRDAFGAHTYRRVDAPDSPVHTEW